MDRKFIVLTLLIGISLLCAPLSISELFDDSDQNNNMISKDTILVIINNPVRENRDLGSDTIIENEPLKIQDPIKEDSNNNYIIHIGGNKVMKTENPLKMDIGKNEELYNSQENDPNNISPTEMSPSPNILSYSSPTIEYQIGTVSIGPSDEEYWSNWASDGDLAVANYLTLSIPGIFQIRGVAPGHHVEYQIGTLMDIGETWSNWASDGDIAAVTYSGLSIPGSIQMRIVVPGCHVEYQIGTLMDIGETWSNWASDGDVAIVTYSGLSIPGSIQMRAVLIAPTPIIINIDPNTLNLKSKGNWVTCYVELSEGYDVNDVDIGTVHLEDTIPAEWGDIQGKTLMVKFDRSEVEDMLSPGTYNLKVTGELNDGTQFEGYSDEIRVIDPPK